MKQDFQSPEFIRQHIQSISDFYRQNSLDPKGGFYQSLMPDGTHRDADIKQLVSSTRMTYNFANTYHLFGCDDDKERFYHGLKFVEEKHARARGYHWLLDGEKIVDDDNYCYGLAFVLLMYSAGISAGLLTSTAKIYQIFDLLEDGFWEEEFGLYGDQSRADWSQTDPYRGQNDNMHACLRGFNCRL